jgi:NAD-specific glutamate dehydrogenase
MSFKTFIQISALSFGITVPSYLHAVVITCNEKEYSMDMSANELAMLQNQLAEFLSAADVMNLNSDTIKNAMTCYLFGKINLDQLSFLSRERFKSSVKQAASAG